MKIVCSVGACVRSYEMRGVRIDRFNRSAFADGWRWNGSRRGTVYRCPRHSGQNAGAE